MDDNDYLNLIQAGVISNLITLIAIAIALLIIKVITH